MSLPKNKSCSEHTNLEEPLLYKASSRAAMVQFFSNSAQNLQSFLKIDYFKTSTVGYGPNNFSISVLQFSKDFVSCTFIRSLFVF